MFWFSERCLSPAFSCLPKCLVTFLSLLFLNSFCCKFSKTILLFLKLLKCLLVSYTYKVRLENWRDLNILCRACWRHNRGNKNRRKGSSTAGHLHHTDSVEGIQLNKSLSSPGRNSFVAWEIITKITYNCIYHIHNIMTKPWKHVHQCF